MEFANFVGFVFSLFLKIAFIIFNFVLDTEIPYLLSILSSTFLNQFLQFLKCTPLKKQTLVFWISWCRGNKIVILKGWGSESLWCSGRTPEKSCSVYVNP